MTTLYEKVGRRYLPVRDTDAYEGLSNGTWLVDIENGRRSTIKTVDTPEVIRRIAAIPRLREAFAPLLMDICRTRPSRPLNPKEKRAWKAYCDVMGPDATLWLERDSAGGLAEKLAERLSELAETTRSDGKADNGA